MANGNGKQGKDEVKGNTKKGPATPEEMQLYSSLADAQAHKPEGRENWELWQFGTPEGKQVWIWGGYGERCLWQVCNRSLTSRAGARTLTWKPCYAGWLLRCSRSSKTIFVPSTSWRTWSAAVPNLGRPPCRENMQRSTIL